MYYEGCNSSPSRNSHTCLPYEFRCLTDYHSYSGRSIQHDIHQYFRRCTLYNDSAASLTYITVERINSMERSNTFHHHPTCGGLPRVSAIIEDELPGKSIQIELETIVVPPATQWRIQGGGGPIRPWPPHPIWLWSLAPPL